MKEYEELSGGLGPTVSFRAKRYLARDVFRDQAVRLRVGGVSHPLYDLAMSGVSFLAAPGQPVGAVNEVVPIEIQLHDCALYQGSAKVVRVERTPERCRVAMELQDGFLDIHEMQRADQDRWFEFDLVDGPERALAAVDHAYRSTLLDAVHFLGFYERCLNPEYAHRLELAHPA